MDGFQGNPLTNHKLPFSTQTIPEIVAPKALTRWEILRTFVFHTQTRSGLTPLENAEKL